MAKEEKKTPEQLAADKVAYEKAQAEKAAKNLKTRAQEIARAYNVDTVYVNTRLEFFTRKDLALSSETKAEDKEKIKEFSFKTK